MIWEPWSTYRTSYITGHKEMRKYTAEELPIKEPPCSCCIFFSPHRKYMHNSRISGSTYLFDGVELCTAKDMHHDYSCFEAKNKEEKEKEEEKK
jgi:hypothetical protein